MTKAQTLASPHPEQFKMEGGCACGYLRYRLENKPIVVHCCHCISCQRETGTAFALNALIEASCVTSLPSAQATVPASPGHDPLVAGPALFSSEEETIAEPDMIMTPSVSQDGQNIARCPKCRVAIWSNYPRAGPLFRFVRVGTLDEAWRVDPDAHVYTQSKRKFVQLDPTVPQFEVFYTDRESIWGKGGIERWERAREGGQ